MPGSDGSPPFDRRDFLRAAAGLGAAALVGAPDGARAAEPPTVKRYAKLGRTGLEISDISFGSGGCKTADLVRTCYDRGINYFDTAEMYRTKGFSRGDYVESLIGEALHDKRDKVVITSKFMAEADHDRHRIMEELEKSLARLRTDYVDIYLNHAVNSLARLTNPEWFEFVELAKKQGKIRFSGLSGHGGKLQECLEHALDHDMVDVVLCSHNFGSDPAFYERFTAQFDLLANQKGLPRLLAKAHQKGVGVIVMKTLMGAKLNDLSAYRKDGATLPQAAFRWVFSDPNVDGLVVSIGNVKRLDEYLAVSGQRGVRPRDAALLRQYVAARGAQYCRNACDSCSSACDQGLAIPDVLRQRMYALDYGDLDGARDGYARVVGEASPCLGCTTLACLNACPHGLDIPALTRETDRILRG
ncbi:MAG: aldo/keto reductase [Myxococcota bacterium]